jgi:hypothetical protein
VPLAAPLITTHRVISYTYPRQAQDRRCCGQSHRDDYHAWHLSTSNRYKYDYLYRLTEAN